MVSKTVGNVNAISGKFEWTIHNFCISCKNVGDKLISPKFTANGDSSNILWHLRLYPKGFKEELKDYLGLFLHANFEIEADATLVIYNNEGKMIVSRTLNKHVFGIQSQPGWGFEEFISRQFITNSVNGTLTDDKLTIVCKVTYTNNKEKYNNVTIQEVKDDASPRLEDKYEALFNNSKFSDISLISEGKTIKVHKCIVAQSSPVFAAMFDAEMKEKQENSVQIADVKYDVLKEMLRFIYTGNVNDINTLAGELAVAADKYALDGLKNTCEKRMIKNLNVDNVISCLQLADRIRMNQLMNKAIEFIAENARDFSDKSKFELLSHDIVCQIFCCLAKKKQIVICAALRYN